MVGENVGCGLIRDRDKGSIDGGVDYSKLLRWCGQIRTSERTSKRKIQFYFDHQLMSSGIGAANSRLVGKF